MFWRKCPTPKAVGAGNALGAPPKFLVAPSCPEKSRAGCAGMCWIRRWFQALEPGKSFAPIPNSEVVTTPELDTALATKQTELDKW